MDLKLGSSNNGSSISGNRSSKLFVVAFYCTLVSFLLFCIIVPTAVRYQLALKDGSVPFLSYVAPPIVTKMEIRIFNVKNIDEYDMSDENFVPVFEEVGPIVYNMTRIRENVKRRGRYITSQIRDTYSYDSESSAVQEDRIVNTVILKNYLASLVHKKPLLGPIKIEELLWDEDVGLFKDVNNKLQTPTTVNSGTLNPFSVYKILDMDGRIRGPFSNGCNRFDGSYEGVGFSPLPYNMKIYFAPFGRNIELMWKKYKYGQATYEFAKDSFNMHLKKNKCFDQMEKYDGAMQLPDIDSNMNPAFVSFPHFLHSKDSRLTSIVGMHPSKTKHTSFFNIEPMSGVPLAGAIRVQINVLSNHSTIIPVIWSDISFEIDEEMTLKLKVVHFLLLVVPLFVSLLFFCVLSLCLCNSYRNYRRKKVGYIMMD